MKSYRWRRLVFYVVVIGTLVTVQTPAIKFVAGAVVDPEFGNQASEVMRENTRDFLLVLFVAIAFEFLARWKDEELRDRLEAHIIAIREEVGSLYEVAVRQLMQTQPAADLFEAALNSTHGDIGNTSQLQQIVLSEKPVIRDLHAKIELRDHPEDDDLYLLTSDETYSVNLKRYLIAVVLGTETLDVLMAECPDVMDFRTTHDERAFAETAAALPATASLTAYVSGARGTMIAKECSLALLNEEQKATALTDVRTSLHTQVHIFEATLPSEHVEHYRVYSETALPRRTRATFWSAERPTFVNSITFDYHNLSRDQGSFGILPMMGAACEVHMSDERRKSIMCDVNSWVVRGQGIVLKWEDDVI